MGLNHAECQVTSTDDAAPRRWAVSCEVQRTNGCAYETHKTVQRHVLLVLLSVLFFIPVNGYIESNTACRSILGGTPLRLPRLIFNASDLDDI